MTQHFATVTALREACRRGDYTGPTIGLAPENLLCNLVVLARAWAYDFLVYCQRNPKACPLIEVLDPGDPVPRFCAPGADLRTDLSRYAIYRDGRRQDDVLNIAHLWQADSVAMLIGSSLTFDRALQRAGVPPSPEVWVLRTGLATIPAGPFGGPLAVTMRWMTAAQAIVATQLTGRFPWTHGAPLHLGDPAVIGADLAHPIWGAPVREIPSGVVPVFWACGVTPQLAVEAARPPLMIAHAPAHGFVTDLKADQFCLP